MVFSDELCRAVWNRYSQQKRKAHSALRKFVAMPDLRITQDDRFRPEVAINRPLERSGKQTFREMVGWQPGAFIAARIRGVAFHSPVGLMLGVMGDPKSSCNESPGVCASK